MSKHLVLGLAVVCHLVLAALYAVTLPAHEGPDENDHCYYAYYLRSSGDLPIILGSAARSGRQPWEEASVGHHPPLYYALLAMGMAMAGDHAPAWRANPDWIGNHPDWRENTEQDGTNDWAYQHPGAAQHWDHGHDEVEPVSPEIAVLRWLRMSSVVFGAVSVVLTYVLGRLLFPNHCLVAGVAALVLACVPQWSMMHGCLDNGNLAAVGSHATLVAIVWALRRQSLGSREGILLGALCGLSVLTKLTAIYLVPLVGGVFTATWFAWRERRSQVLRSALIALAVFGALCGWVFVRNATLYGDLLALDAHRAAFASNTLPDDMRWEYLLGEFPVRAFRSAIGEFGWSVLPAPGWVVAAFGVPLALGWLLSLLRGVTLWRSAGPSLLAVVAAIALASAGFLRFNMTFFQPQGRYLFPIYGPLVMLAAAGILIPLHSLWSRVGRAGVLLLTAPPLVAGIVFASYFAPAFAVDPTDDERWPRFDGRGAAHARAC